MLRADVRVLAGARARPARRHALPRHLRRLRYPGQHQHSHHCHDTERHGVVQREVRNRKVSSPITGHFVAGNFGLGTFVPCDV